MQIDEEQSFPIHLQTERIFEKDNLERYGSQVDKESSTPVHLETESDADKGLLAYGSALQDHEEQSIPIYFQLQRTVEKDLSAYGSSLHVDKGKTIQSQSTVKKELSAFGSLQVVDEQCDESDVDEENQQPILSCCLIPVHLKGQSIVVKESFTHGCASELDKELSIPIDILTQGTVEKEKSADEYGVQVDEEAIPTHHQTQIAVEKLACRSAFQVGEEQSIPVYLQTESEKTVDKEKEVHGFPLEMDEEQSVPVNLQTQSIFEKDNIDMFSLQVDEEQSILGYLQTESTVEKEQSLLCWSTLQVDKEQPEQKKVCIWVCSAS